MPLSTIPCQDFDDQEVLYRALRRLDGMRRHHRAWECFINKARAMMLHQIRHRIHQVVRVGTDEATEDIFSDQLSRFSERVAAGRFDDPETRKTKFTTILYQMCNAAAIDRYRLESSRPTTPTDWTGVDWNPALTDPQAGSDELLITDTRNRHHQEALRRAVDQLPEQQRVAIELAYFEELPDAAIAEQMQSNIRNVYNLKYKAIKRLRESGDLNDLTNDEL